MLACHGRRIAVEILGICGAPKYYRRFPLLILVSLIWSTDCGAFGFFDGTVAQGLQRGSRWDSEPRILAGVERSLNGGLRFSLQGGSYQAYRDLITWQGPAPSVAAFEQAVLDAFEVWKSTDPATGLDTVIDFVPDLGTPVSTVRDGFVLLGSEIDIFASPDGNRWNPGNSNTQAEAVFYSISVSGNLTLTSGVTGYGGFAIAGADITFNNNPGARYTLSGFQTILTHEIGHALGLADVDFTSGPQGTYIDDNYNGTSPATARATLTNSFAHLIDPSNPGASPLASYFVEDGSPGFDTSGVNILMESRIPSVFFNNGAALSNDDFAGRQFLYPVTVKPPLDISVDGDEIVLQWRDSVGWSLYRTGNLDGTWQRSASQGTVQGVTRTVRLPITAADEFFRLQRFTP